ncbi:Uncharacterised protein [uncultured Blautia sp.]|nr:hypothetical protein [uncultured Blautia sp.]SCI24931.1 Uncharacterised protein [uncultured Blautia sp.]
MDKITRQVRIEHWTQIMTTVGSGTRKLVIIPGLSEPPVRTLRATIPENGSHIFR